MRKELAWLTIALAMVAMGAWWAILPDLALRPVCAATTPVCPGSGSASRKPGPARRETASSVPRTSGPASPGSRPQPAFAPRSQADVDNLREFVVRTAVTEMTTQSRLERIYLTVDDADPPHAFLVRFDGSKPPVVRGSSFTNWDREREVAYLEVKLGSWKTDDVVTVEVGRGTWQFAGRGESWLLERRGRTWVIVRREITWVS